MEKISSNIFSIIKEKYLAIGPYLNERSRRIWAASETKSIGCGGKKIVSRATGLTFKTIQKGREELESDSASKIDLSRVRKSGGSRKKKTETDINLQIDIERTVESSTRGDPEVALLWCSKSTRNIAAELNKDFSRISHRSVGKILDKLGYSLQSNRKVKEGSSHPDRDAQFNFINNKVKEFQARKEPVISVDTKKKENIGEFKNNGLEYSRVCHQLRLTRG